MREQSPAMESGKVCGGPCSLAQKFGAQLKLIFTQAPT